MTLVPKRAPRILLVEESGAPGRALESALGEAGFHVTRLRPPGLSGSATSAAQSFDAVVAGLGPAAHATLDLLQHLRERDPGLALVALVGRGDGASALTALRAGATGVHERPVDAGAIVESVRRALSQRALLRRIEELEVQVEGRSGLIARSRAMARVAEQVEHIAPTRTTLLLEGEPGTGKRRIARTVHARSPRRTARFVVVDCGTQEGPAIESVLFGPGGGTEAGVPGALELADGGTLYLERIGEAPPAIQVQLLRVLQDRTWERPGGGGEVRVDVRLIVSSDRDLAGDVESGRFRRDLFERLSVARLVVPPLRERREDLPLLVREILRRRPRERGRRVSGITPGALDRLLAYPWPGNVRELEQMVDGMWATAEGGRPLGLDDLPAPLRPAGSAGIELVPGMTVEEAERALIAATLRHTGGDKAKAAALLGIGVRTLYRKLGARR